MNERMKEQRAARIQALVREGRIVECHYSQARVQPRFQATIYTMEGRDLSPKPSIENFQTVQANGPETSTSPSASMHRVLATTELLGAILEFVDSRTLLLMQRVDRRMYSVIQSSPSLQARLWFCPDPIDGGADNEPCFNPFMFKTERLIPKWSYGANFETDNATVIQVKPTSNEAMFRPEASWRRMLVAQSFSVADGWAIQGIDERTCDGNGDLSMFESMGRRDMPKHFDRPPTFSDLLAIADREDTPSVGTVAVPDGLHMPVVLCTLIKSAPQHRTAVDQP